MAKLKTLNREPKKLITFKVSKSDLEALKKNAAKYAHGNLSEWVRYTGLNYKPKKTELVESDES